jgi:hypothetical protein
MAGLLVVVASRAVLSLKGSQIPAAFMPPTSYS